MLTSYVNLLTSLIRTPGIPVPERFAFCLNTLLSDIASLNEETAAEIVNHQINLLLTLASTIETSLADSTPSDQRSTYCFPRSSSVN